MELLFKLFNLLSVPPEYGLVLAQVLSLMLFALFVWLVGYVCRKLSEKLLIDKVFKGRFQRGYNALKRDNFFAALGYLAAGFVAIGLLDFFFPQSYEKFHSFGSRLVGVYFQVCILITLNKILSLIIAFYGNNPNIPIKGIVQAVKILVNFFGVLIILAWILGKEPFVLISALGIFASVAMLVFKDPILGLTASFQLSLNDMLRIGDWIEMPKHGADGDVIDISLTSVRVQNWDKTIVSIPAYDLISSSFKNWRGMSDAGGRRIKRAINIDLQTIKFIDAAMLKRLKKIELLSGYLEKKEAEIAEYNASHNVNESLLNGRNLTNVGTFRAYCEEYIKSRDYIHKTFIAMVRQLEPGPQGLPLEVYCFTATTAWIEYEGYQSDLFDHLFAVMKEFELRPFQNPSSGDISALSARLIK